MVGMKKKLKRWKGIKKRIVKTSFRRNKSISWDNEAEKLHVVHAHDLCLVWVLFGIFRNVENIEKSENFIHKNNTDIFTEAMKQDTSGISLSYQTLSSERKECACGLPGWGVFRFRCQLLLTLLSSGPNTHDLAQDRDEKSYGKNNIHLAGVDRWS